MNRWFVTFPDEPACWSWPIPDDREAPGARGWSLLRDWQDGRCAVCGRDDELLVADHDYGSGLIRGQLCRGCNVQEGSAREGHPAYGMYQQYRERYPTLILGLHLLYKHRPWKREALAAAMHAQK